MREIKFRAWDKALKIMGRVVELSFADNGKVFKPAVARVQNLRDFGQVEHYVTSDEIENQLYIEQYTGLKDKNGVEIYEGDIIQTNESLVQTVVGITPIYINENIYTLVQATKSLSGEIFILDNSDVVIGNIHENQELLEVD
jgi:uncharacterized phage protein (TIGR01671 family)